MLERTAKLPLLASNAGGVIPFDNADDVTGSLGNEIYKHLRREHFDKPYE